MAAKRKPPKSTRTGPRAGDAPSTRKPAPRKPGARAVGERGVSPLPIDYFFQSLARDQERRAVGIVLSGNATDGTLGLAAIQAKSGLSIAQDPRTAEFDGMPANAIAARATDLILSIPDMA